MTHQPDQPPSERRRAWPVRIYRLGEEPGDDLSAWTTPEERVALVWELSRRMWALTGRPSPENPRRQLSIRILPRRD